MKKALLFIFGLIISNVSQARTSAYCGQQFSFITQNYGVAVAQGNDDKSFIRAAKKPGSKRFICDCQAHHKKFIGGVIDAKQRAFMTGKLFVGKPPKSLKSIVCK